MRSPELQRFAKKNSFCPVRTHQNWRIFNDLGRPHLRQKTSFAAYCAPAVHQTPPRISSRNRALSKNLIFFGCSIRRLSLRVLSSNLQDSYTLSLPLVLWRNCNCPCNPLADPVGIKSSTMPQGGAHAAITI